VDGVDALQEISTAAPAGMSSTDIASWADGYAMGLASPPETLLKKINCHTPHCQERSQCATLMEPHWTHVRSLCTHPSPSGQVSSNYANDSRKMLTGSLCLALLSRAADGEARCRNLASHAEFLVYISLRMDGLVCCASPIAL
jgi:hypothetical protein